MSINPPLPPTKGLCLSDRSRQAYLTEAGLESPSPWQLPAAEGPMLQAVPGPDRCHLSPRAPNADWVPCYRQAVSIWPEVTGPWSGHTRVSCEESQMQTPETA